MKWRIALLELFADADGLTVVLFTVVARVGGDPLFLGVLAQEALGLRLLPRLILTRVERVHDLGTGDRPGPHVEKLVGVAVNGCVDGTGVQAAVDEDARGTFNTACVCGSLSPMVDLMVRAASYGGTPSRSMRDTAPRIAAVVSSVMRFTIAPA
jgi:hypothetical protein